MTRNTWIARLLPALVALFLALPLEAQKKPETCPWCKNDPALLQACGVLSHGPSPVGPKGSEAIVHDLPAGQWLFAETAHMRWASSLGPMVVELDDKKRVMAELDRLRVMLPDVPKEPKKLDPWLRLHLMAMKGEEFYARFEKLLDVRDEDFPDARRMDKPYMGNGRYLGEKEKFDVVVHSTLAAHNLFTKEFTGASVTGALRWHFKEPHKMLVSVPAEDHDLKKDRWLWPHIVHNLSHVFFCAYKHFSYDPPIWIDEGLALALEKEVEPESATLEGEEGSMRDGKGPKDYAAAAKKLVGSGKARSLAELTEVKEFGELSPEDKVAVWSRVRFLIEAHPAELAKFLGGIKGQLDAQQLPTGSDLPGLQRKLLQDLGWTSFTFDEAWKSWAR
ncbi:MAG: hypothetical protein IPJ19_04705 [Planctomycetes bacterium]|nr:hypothetical protein [Planctomycetota bacterium]